MSDIKALNYEQLIMEAKLKKKGKRNPDYFSQAVKSEIEELIVLPYHYKDTHSMQKLILHLNLKNYLKYKDEDAESAETNLIMVAKKLLIEKFSHDDYVFRQDSEGDKFYIILSGTVIGISESARFDSYGNELFKDQKEVIRLGEGNSFGEMALISGASRSLSMKAYNDVTLISLHKDDFLKCFGDKISDKIMEIKSFLEGVKYFKHFKEPDLKTLASKLILRNCKNNQMLCDQGEQCRNLFILKNGQIILTRIVDTQKVDLSEFPPVLIQKLKQLPEKIEIEVKTKYHSGDILLLTEVLNGRQSKYRLKSGLPSQVFVCTAYDLKRYLGMEKFATIPDADYFTSTDEEILKYHLEQLTWSKYKQRIIDNQFIETKKKEFYLGSGQRQDTKVILSKTVCMDSQANTYFQTKEQFYSHDKRLLVGKKEAKPNKKLLETSSNLRLAPQIRSTNNRNGPSDTYGLMGLGGIPNQLNQAELSSKLSQSGGYFFSNFTKQQNLLKQSAAIALEKSNTYKNEMDDEHVASILKFQVKKIVGAAYTGWLRSLQETAEKSKLGGSVLMDTQTKQGNEASKPKLPTFRSMESEMLKDVVSLKSMGILKSNSPYKSARKDKESTLDWKTNKTSTHFMKSGRSKSYAPAVGFDHNNIPSQLQLPHYPSTAADENPHHSGQQKRDSLFRIGRVGKPMSFASARDPKSTYLGNSTLGQDPVMEKIVGGHKQTHLKDSLTNKPGAQSTNERRHVSEGKALPKQTPMPTRSFLNPDKQQQIFDPASVRDMLGLLGTDSQKDMLLLNGPSKLKFSLETKQPKQPTQQNPPKPVNLKFIDDLILAKHKK